MKTCNSRLLNPAEYPDYTRRRIRVPTWKTFDHQTQFTTLRVFSQRKGKLVNFEEDLDLYQKFNLGRIIWPVIQTLYATNFNDLVASIKRRGLYLYDFWGHIPGANTEQMWGHHTPLPGQVACLEKTLGSRFLGIDNGEQDGRYVGLYAPQQCPCPQDRYEQFLNFHRHFERMGDDLGNHLTVLVSLCYGHYFMKEGNHILIGAETAQCLPNSQVYYAFIRGAGKQYGVHWFGNASIFNRWGWKTYETSGERGGYKYGPEQGTSLSLLKRLLYSHYLYNSVAIGFENAWIVGDDVEKRLLGQPVRMETDPSSRVLSPVGEIQSAAAAFVKKHGQPGVMQTPVALMTDFFSGWAMPRHAYARNYAYQVWGGMPYDAGDHLTDMVLSLLYPGYEDSGYFHDERGYMTPTPYGDVSDCILSDAAPQVLRQYGLIIVTGTLAPGAEVRDNLRSFVEAGGEVILTAANAFLAPGLAVTGAPARLPAGTAVRWHGGERDAEADAFELCPAVLPKRAEVLARCGRAPAVVRVPAGKGSYTVLLSSSGLNVEPLVKGSLPIAANQAYGDGRKPSNSVDDQPLPRPFRLLKHVRRLLDAALKSQRLFSAPEGLTLITCRKKKGEYTLGLFNNHLSAHPLKIESHCGAIRSMNELPLGQSEKGKPGYWPTLTLTPDNDGGVSDSATIAGGDVRLFSVRVRERGVRSLAPVSFPARPRGRVLSLRPVGTLQEAILRRPTFFQHFDGVKVDWTWLWRRDAAQLERESGWLQRQQLRLIVDFSHGCNFYPDLALLDTHMPRYRESMGTMEDVLSKMSLLGAKDAVLSLHRWPDDHSVDAALADARFLSGIREICGKASRRGVVLHLQTHPHKWHATTERTLQFIEEVGKPNLRYALNTSHLAMLGENLRKSLALSKKRLGMILLSAPVSDMFNQALDAHAPVAGSGLDLSALRAYGNVLQVLDADFKSLDEEYQDCRAVWER